MITLIVVMLTIGGFASLALASACLIGQALVDSLSYPAELEADDAFVRNSPVWQSSPPA